MSHQPTTAEATQWRRRSGTLWRWTIDSLLVQPPDSDELLALDVPGQALWEALREPRTLTQAAEIIADSAGAPPDLIASDLVPVLEELERAGALQRVE